jgi:hypothetical protein
MIGGHSGWKQHSNPDGSARLGPSLSSFGLSNVLADPTLNCITRTGRLWCRTTTGRMIPPASQLTANGLAWLTAESGITAFAPGQFLGDPGRQERRGRNSLVEIYKLR